VLLILKSVTIHWIASGWGPGRWAQQEQRSPARIVSTAGSLTSPSKRGGADFSPRPRQRACQDHLTRQGGDALTSSKASVGNSLFNSQNLPCLVSLHRMLGISVESWTKGDFYTNSLGGKLIEKSRLWLNERINLIVFTSILWQWIAPFCATYTICKRPTLDA
jgi:hypothetical protein